MKYWNSALTLVRGCTPVSAGCDHCWFRGLQKRFPEQIGDPGVVRFDPKPLLKLERAKKPRVWSVWADLFHEAIDDDTILRCLGYFERAKDQIILVLTKRAARAARLWPFAFSNVWLGTSAEDQETYDKRWPHLDGLKGKYKHQKMFLSAEPLLGQIDICPWFPDVVVFGPENGQKKRECKPEWIDSIESQCARLKIWQIRKDVEWPDFNAVQFWK